MDRQSVHKNRHTSPAHPQTDTAAPNRTPLPPEQEGILQLQQLIGNQAVQRLMANPSDTVQRQDDDEGGFLDSMMNWGRDLYDNVMGNNEADSGPQVELGEPIINGEGGGPSTSGGGSDTITMPEEHITAGGGPRVELGEPIINGEGGGGQSTSGGGSDSITLPEEHITAGGSDSMTLPEEHIVGGDDGYSYHTDDDGTLVFDETEPITGGDSGAMVLDEMEVPAGGDGGAMVLDEMEIPAGGG